MSAIDEDVSVVDTTCANAYTDNWDAHSCYRVDTYINPSAIPEIQHANVGEQHSVVVI